MPRIHSDSLKSGFTLIELMIVVAIVAILSAVGIATFSGLTKRSQEAKRAGDANQISKALDQYWTNNSSYPVTLPTPGQTFKDNLGNNFMTNFPTDALTSQVYYYAASPSTCNGTSTNPCTSYILNTNSTTIAPPPVGWWKMDECQGSIASDSSGNSNSATITIGTLGTQLQVGTCTDGNPASAWYNGAAGKINSSLNVDGTDDYVSVPNSNSLSISTSAITLAGWYKATSLGGIQMLAVKGQGGASWNYGFGFSGSTLTARHNESDISSGITTSSGSWHHFALVYLGGHDYFYLDGVLVANVSESYSEATGPYVLAIGAAYDGNTASYFQKFKGQIDDVRIYNYARSADQIAQDMSGK